MKIELSFVVALSLGALLPRAAAAQSVADCHIAAYRMTDGSVIDVGPTDGPALRWRRFDGATGELRQAANGSWTSTLGWTDRADGHAVAFSDCAAGELRFDKLIGKRIEFAVTETAFE